MSIRLKLIIVFLAIALIPIFFVSTLTFTNYKNSLEANRFSQLRDLTIFRADRIEAYFAGLKAHMEIAQGFYNIKKNLPVLTRLANDQNSPEFLAAKKMLDEQLQQMQSVSDLSDIMLVNPEGKVVYAIKPEHYYKDMSNGVDAEQKAFTEGKSRIYFSDVYFDKAEDNRFEMLLTAPASDFNGAFIGVIAFEVDMTPVYKLIQDVNGLGNTGEVLVARKIGNQVVFLNPLRHDPNAVLNKKINIGEKSGFGIQEAVQGKTGAGQYFDYRGKKVIAAWRYIPSIDWGMVAKIDADEAFVDVTNLRNLAGIILAIVIVLSSITAFSIAQSISEPIKKLSKGAEIIGSGNLDYKIGTKSKDEIGQLSRTFDKMTSDLKQTTASRDELNKEINERRQTEQALRESQQDLNRAQAVAHSGSWRLDVQQDKLAWSDEAYRIFGVPTGTAMTYESFLSYVHPEDREYVDTKWKAALSGEKYDIEHRIVVDGQTKWVRERAELEFDKDGTLLGGFGTVTDITQRKQAEEALLASEIRYRRLFEAARDGILILDTDSGRIVDVNPFIKNMLGYSHEELLNKKLWEIGLFKNIAASKESFLELQTKGYVRYENMPLETKDGRRIAVEFVSNVYLVDHRKVIQCNIRDITDRVRAEEELRKSRDELEMRVKERTADLDEMVTELQKQVEQRIAAEETVKAERKRFEDVLEMMPAYAVLLTPDYQVAYANRTFREWFGDDNGRKCYEFLFKRTEPCESCETYTVLKTGKSHFWEWTGPNGRNYDIYDYPFTDTDGSPLIMEIGVDVTAHKQAQKAVKQGEERYRSLTVATTQVVWTTDAQGQVVGDLPSWREFTGQSVDEIRGWGWINSLHPDDRDRTAEIWKQSVQNKTLYETEYRMLRRDGQYRYVSVRGVPVLEPNGSIREWIGTCTDITDRKTAEERQNVTNSLLELFAKKTTRKDYLDSTVGVIRKWSGCEFIGIRIRDNDGNIPYESYVGFDREFLSLENALHLKRDKCVCIRAILENPQKQERQLMSAGGSFYCNDSLAFLDGLSEEHKKEYRGNCIKRGFQSIAVVPIRYHDEVFGAIHLTDYKKDMVLLPKIHFIEATIAPLIGEAIQRFNAEAELEKYRLHLEDLVKQRTEELARSNKDLEQFAYVASHDLQEPLRAVSGFVELLRRNLQSSLDDKTKEYMNFTIDGAKRMQSLIIGLLEYSRVGTQGKNPQKTDSKAALDEAIARLQASIKETGAKITIDGLPTIHFDDVQLTQLFQNLIGNAIKFRSEQAPRIHINAVRKDSGWQFAVTDNGIGIEPQYTERIFQIFQRLHGRGKYPGTGIGLSICKKIVERHNGKIWVESKPGNGSTFYFTVPDLGEA